MISIHCSSRGFAVLALLCLAVPRVSALTITQTAKFDLLGFTSGSLPTTLGADWDFAPFAEPGANLTSVTVNGTVSINASVTEVNPFQVPLGNGAFVLFDSRINLGAFSVVLATNQASAGGGIIPPHGAQTVNVALANTFSLTTTDPALLGFFTAGDLPLTQGNKFSGSTSYGYASAIGTSNLSITYTYAVSENGSSLLLFAGALGLIGCGLRRRMSLSRPT